MRLHRCLREQIVIVRRRYVRLNAVHYQRAAIWPVRWLVLANRVAAPSLLRKIDKGKTTSASAIDFGDGPWRKSHSCVGYGT
jgi:hypothetical protein